MNFLNFYESNDERRKLYDWDVNFNCKSIKLIYLNPGNTVGKHFHKKKDELFVLSNGNLKMVKIGDTSYYEVKAPAAWIIPKETYHEYFSEEQITLLCLASEKFDHSDDFFKK